MLSDFQPQRLIGMWWVWSELWLGCLSQSRVYVTTATFCQPLEPWKTWKGHWFFMQRSTAAAGRMQPHLAGWTLTKSKWNARVHKDRSRYIRSLTHPHKQTIKVNHFLLTSKLKLSVPRGAVLLECCVLMTASSQGYEMQTRPGGGIIVYPPTITNYSVV